MIFIIYTAEIRFLRRVSVHKPTGHVRNVLQIYTLDERIEDDTNKQHNNFLRTDSSNTDLKI
jgi:hypothetical protein